MLRRVLPIVLCSLLAGGVGGSIGVALAQNNPFVFEAIQLPNSPNAPALCTDSQGNVTTSSASHGSCGGGQSVISNIIGTSPITVTAPLPGTAQINCGPCAATNVANVFTAGQQINGGLALIDGALGTLSATGQVIAGSGTAPIIFTAGDLISSNSATTGTLLMGGGTSDAPFTFSGTNINTGAFTLGAPTIVSGNASGFGSTLQVAANPANAPTLANGDIGASESATTGQITLGGNSQNCNLDYGITVLMEFTTACFVNAAHGLGTTALNATSILDTGLSGLSTPQVVCGNSASNISSGTTASEASSGNTSNTQSATANTYVSFATVSLTTGTSCGPQNKWLITITVPLEVSTGVAGFYYGCMASASTYTFVDGPTNSALATCTTTLTNSFAGSPDFGDTTAGTATGSGYTMISHVTVANSTTFSVTVETAVSIASAANKIFGYVNLVATPI